MAQWRDDSDRKARSHQPRRPHRALRFRRKLDRYFRQVSARTHAERRSGFRSGAGQPMPHLRWPDTGHPRIGRRSEDASSRSRSHSGSSTAAASSRCRSLRRSIPPQVARGWEMWLDEPVLVGIQKRAARVTVRLSSQWPSSALELRTRERVHAERMESFRAWFPMARARPQDLRSYVNGSPVGDRFLHDQLSGAMRPTMPNSGSASKSPTPRRSPGGLDDLRFYARALSPRRTIRRHGRRVSD